MFKWFKRLIVLFVLIFVSYRIYLVHESVKKVETYRGMVAKSLAENGTNANIDLILAIIYTETKGTELDVMQSSESIDGQANSIIDSKESIKQGVKLLTDNLVLANKKKTDAWSAVQAYNFGTGYIDYVSKHGKKHTIGLAKAYSRDIVAPSLGNKTGETYFYHHPLAVISGGRLYKNGGNIYYAREVHFNLWLMHLFNW
ncbi:lysozyme family protein [Streptococcus sciuri]|uniref:Lysozyme family protein n=1 Tax=Streptococcus sciuri TaxID=2973939 RepID=A0ABT2F595_9STRE|nr:lysozyme family protein [Streptococcus sciuri]MCS4487604.1 lysozyme family protein [Streptococcus sciuri]